MYLAIQDAKQIKLAQTELLKQPHEVLPLVPDTFTIGYQGGSFPVDDLRSNGHVWFAHHVDNTSKVHRNWNAFGVATELRLKASNKIVVEANVALNGQSRMVAGLFIKDEKSGNTILVHSGKIGGGRKG